MAISKKGKRKIEVNGKVYLWWVFDEYDQTAFDGIQIKIVAQDQSLYFKYGLQQTLEERYLVIALGKDAGLIHIPCPKFENEEKIITPAGISKLINWCNGISFQEVTWVTDLKGKSGMLNKEQAMLVYKKIEATLNNS